MVCCGAFRGVRWRRSGALSCSADGSMDGGHSGSGCLRRITVVPTKQNKERKGKDGNTEGRVQNGTAPTITPVKEERRKDKGTRKEVKTGTEQNSDQSPRARKRKKECKTKG